MDRRIRAFEPNEDLDVVVAIDKELETDREYVVERTPGGLALETVPLAQRLRKRFPFDASAEPWTHAYVAVEGQSVRGFIATSIEEWNSRLTIRHLYVDRSARRRGMGRALVEHVCGLGQQAGAATAWVETSNRNVPGVLAYQRLGFALCGFDLSIYRGTPAEGEFALFLCRDLLPNGAS